MRLTSITLGMLALAVLAPMARAGEIEEAIAMLEEPTDEHGQDAILRHDQTGADDHGWRFDATLYMWAVSLTGKTSIAETEADVDLGFSDILDDLLDAALFFRFEAWKDRSWGLMLDLSWVDMSLSENVKVPNAGGLKVGVDLDIRQFDVLVAGAYRIFDVPFDEETPRHSNVTGPGFLLDVYGGARFGYLRQKLSLDPGPKLGDSATWIEPVIGLRAAWAPWKWLTLAARGDIGGFGLGSAPDRDIFLLLGANFRLGSVVSVRAGYQWRWFDFESGSGEQQFGMDVTYQGPYLGLTFTF